MFKRLITKIVSNILDEEIEKRLSVSGPVFKMLKMIHVKNGNKISVWEALSLNPSRISLCVNWVDENGLETFRSYSAVDVPSFMGIIKGGITLEQVLFDSVALHVKVLDSDAICESLIPKCNPRNLRYNSSELVNIVKQLKEWIDKKEELLI
jgi:hypothetical protein